MNKVIFCRSTWMDKYEGIEPLTTGGRHPQTAGWANEMFNFKKEVDGCYYGGVWVMPRGHIDLKKIADKREIKSDINGEYIDEVLVVFVSSSPLHGQVIIGYYKNAKVYAKPIDNANPTRFVESKNLFASYNLVCKIEDGLLLSVDDRTHKIPKGRGSIGQKHIWYPNFYDNNDGAAVRDSALEYIERVERVTDDYNDLMQAERVFSEGAGRGIVSIQTKERNANAIKEAKRIHGYKCCVCGFDFFNMYGDAGNQKIVIHHLIQIADGERVTDPTTDLVPVCDNCHAIIHKKRPMYTIEEVRKIINFRWENGLCIRK